MRGRRSPWTSSVRLLSLKLFTPSHPRISPDVQISTALAAETGLSSDDIVSISPIPDEHLHEADSITIRQIDEGIGQGNRSTRILNKGKGRALHPDDERAALQDILQDALSERGISENLGICPYMHCIRSQPRLCHDRPNDPHSRQVESYFYRLASRAVQDYGHHDERQASEKRRVCSI